MSARNRLLVIDYEPRSLKRTLALLEITGCSIRSASNAKEIAAALAEEPPDAAIIEPMIPGQDGFKLIQQVKRLRPGDPVYVIAASRIYRGPRFRGMAKEAGADLFLERPAHDDQILAALEKILGGFTPPEEAADAAISIEVDEAHVAPPMASAEIPSPPPIVPSARAPVGAVSTAPHEPKIPVPAPQPPASSPTPARVPETGSIPRPAVPRPTVPRPAAPLAPAASAAPAGASAGPAPSTSPRTTGASVLMSSPVPMIQTDPSEIDAALDRLLGSFGDFGSAPAPIAAPTAIVAGPAPPAEPAAPPPPPAEPVALPEREASSLALDADFRGRRTLERRVTGPQVQFHFEDAVTGDAPRPVVIPTRTVVPPPIPVIEPIPSENLGYDLVTGDSGNISAAPPADDASDPQYMDFLLQEDPGTGPPPVDPSMKSRTGPILTSAEQPLLPNPDDEDIDRILARVFSPGADASGGIPGLDPDAKAASAAEGDSRGLEVPGSPPPPVPEGLRGMDAGTADLLSSLQELENSLPDGGPPSEFRPESTWTSTTGFGEATGQALRDIETSVPYVPPPPPEDERTLEEVLSGISLEAQPTAEEISPPLASPKVEFDAFRQTGVGLGMRGRFGTGALDSAAVPTSRRPGPAASPTVPSRSLVTGALIALLLLAIAVGGWYLFLHEGGRGESVAGPGTRAVEPRDFPAAPAPVAPRRKPKLKVKPSNAAATEPAMTRPVPEAALRSPAKSPSARREASPAGESAPSPPPPPARPQPSPASASVFPNQRPSPTPIPAGSAEQPQMSAADTPTSAADMSAADTSMSAADTPIVRASELDGPIQATRRAVPQPTRAAVEAKLGGRAFLNVLVAGDGSVQEARLMIDPGLGLGEAARSAAESWSYSRPTRQGKPVRVWKTEVVEFEVPSGDDD